MRLTLRWMSGGGESSAPGLFRAGVYGCALQPVGTIRGEAGLLRGLGTNRSMRSCRVRPVMPVAPEGVHRSVIGQKSRWRRRTGLAAAPYLMPSTLP